VIKIVDSVSDDVECHPVPEVLKGNEDMGIYNRKTRKCD
jgi:hypothetical protein